MIASLTKDELTALAEVVDLWEKLLVALSNVQAHPRGHSLHICSEIEPFYLGWVGYDESGTLTFQPAKEAS